MLLELQIKDFAIIEHLHLSFDRGFHVLSGETGAGKSIIIDALGIIRGDKPDPTFVRAGTSRARIEAIFSLENCPEIIPLLQSYDLMDEEDEQVVITREVSSETGRSTARINRRAVNSAILRDVGSRLIDIHGQHEGLSLFNTRTHLDMLDRYGGLLPLREEVAEYVTRLHSLREALADLRENEAQRTARIEELRLLLDDVTTAELRADEEQELQQERQVLQNAVRITELARSAYAALYEGDEGGTYPVRPVVPSMATISGDLGELARLDPSVESLMEQANDLHYQLEDLATNLRAYRDRLDFDPARLDEIEDRLALLRSLKRKYNADIPQIIEQATNAEAEIDRLSHSAEHIAELEEQEAALLAEISERVSQLSRRRRHTGYALSQTIEQAMQDLAMKHVRFAVSMARAEAPDGVTVIDAGNSDEPPHEHDTSAQVAADGPASDNHHGHRRYAFDKTGIDRVEFMISPNPGEPLKPLARIASGGESARLLLALKSILSHVDTIPTLVFDEIDVGVGGRAGQVVGQKLWGMTETHQVLCITHLPQVAAFADTHFAIKKEVISGAESANLRTHTSVQILSLEDRVTELAAMLDGTPVSEHSLISARGIIERAMALKTSSIAAGSQKPGGSTAQETQASQGDATYLSPTLEMSSTP